MASRKSSKTVTAVRDDIAACDTLSQANVSVILAAINSQGDDLKKLIDGKMTALSGRLDTLDAAMANLQSEQTGFNLKLVDVEEALNEVADASEKLKKSARNCKLRTNHFGLS